MKYLILLFVVFSSLTISAQNKINFKECKKKLSPYTQCGKIKQTILKKNERSKLLKPLLAKKSYRIIACSVDNEDKIHLTLTTTSGKIIFDNSINNYAKKHDFTVKKTGIYILNISFLGNSNKKQTHVNILLGEKK